MKKKKILFLLLLILIPIIKIKADNLTCSYISDTLNIDVIINDNDKIKKINFYGCIPDASYKSGIDDTHACLDSKNKADKGDNIDFTDANGSVLENWNKKTGSVDFKAKEYFTNNQRKCLPYAYLVDRIDNYIGDEAGLDLILSDEAHTSDYETYASKKQAYVKLNLSTPFIPKEDKICNYSSDILSAKYVIKNGEVSKVDLDGCIPDANYTGGIDDTHACRKANGAIDQTEPIENWNKMYESINFLGRKEFLNTLDCAPYAYLIDTKNGLHFVVSSESLTSSFEAVASKKQAYVKLTYDGATESEKDKQEKEKKDDVLSCYGLDKATCKNNDSFSCVWVEGKNGNPSYCNTDELQYVKCGSSFDIPDKVPVIMSFIINFFKILVPILLVIMSIISLVKALGASKEDEIKKAQSSLVRRLIAGALAFFVISIVQFIILKVADSSEYDDISACFSCLLNNDCDTNTYFKTSVFDEYECHLVNSPNTKIDCQ